MSLHPVFQIEVDGEDITVMPEYVQSFTYKSSIEALTTMDFTIIDPSFTKVEELLLNADKRGLPIYSRFGYLDNKYQLSSDWLQSRLMNYSPTLTTKGMEITASTLVDVGVTVVEVGSEAVSGKYSRVVEQIAQRLGVEYEIEETNDEIHEADPKNRGKPTVWAPFGLTWFKFIRDKILPYCVSKSGRANYDFFISGVGVRIKKPILHFHTIGYEQCSLRKKPIKEFTYLAGAQDQVLEFVPTYSSSTLGALGAGQVVLRAFDPASKRYATSVQNSRKNKDSASIGDGTKSVSKPTTLPGQGEDLKTQGGFLMLAGSVDDSDPRSRNTWDLLKCFSFTAVLTLVGLPDYKDKPGSGTVDIEANDWVRVNVLIPTGDPKSPTYKRHWTSGTYRVNEAVHDIRERYTVTCQLQRDSAEVGTEPKSGVNVIEPGR